MLRANHLGLHINLTLQATNISLTKACLEMIFLFPRWEMFVPWRVSTNGSSNGSKFLLF